MATPARIESTEIWNSTKVVARKGATYRFDVPEDATWKDSIVRCGPRGFFNLVDPFRIKLRVKKAHGKKARYFTLIGTIGQTLEHAFIIGSGCTYTAEADGEFYCFANDALGHYDNNHGAITVSITQL